MSEVVLKEEDIEAMGLCGDDMGGLGVSVPFDEKTTKRGNGV